MSVRLLYQRRDESGWQILHEFSTEDEGRARAVELSGSAQFRARPSWDSISGRPARGFEYQRGDETWLVEVDDS